MLVPFTVRKLRDSAVVWRNNRLLLEAGVDICDVDVAAEVDKWLLSEFSYSAPLPEDPTSAYGAEDRTFGADRYGFSTGTWAGGSGRCGVSGLFNVKGLGRTPLVGRNVDIAHSSGIMHLSEAILEVIASEVVHPELPHGCVPIIAIIDMGFSSKVGDVFPSRRRALVVRPNFIRPAHFERSIFFGRGGTTDSEQYLDAQRVKRAIEIAGESIFAGTEELPFFLERVFTAAAVQAGAAQAHRIWLSQFVSSNRCISGALADFGGVRAVPSWRAFQTAAPEQFGSELIELFSSVEALCHYFQKYLGSHPRINVADYRQKLFAECRRSFEKACLMAVGEDSAEHFGGAVQALLWYFTRQQTEAFQADDRRGWKRPWLLDALNKWWRKGATPGDPEVTVAAELIQAIRQLRTPFAEEATLNAICRWLLPRAGMYQFSLGSRLSAFLRTLACDGLDRMRVQQFIDRQVTAARRVWIGLPGHLVIKGQAIASETTVLFCKDCITREEGVLLIGVRVGHEVLALGRRFPLDGFPTVYRREKQWGFWLSNNILAHRVDAGLRSQLSMLRRRAFFYPFANSCTI